MMVNGHNAQWASSCSVPKSNVLCEASGSLTTYATLELDLVQRLNCQAQINAPDSNQV